MPMKVKWVALVAPALPLHNDIVLTAQLYVLFSQTVLRLGGLVKSGFFTKPKKFHAFPDFQKMGNHHRLP